MTRHSAAVRLALVTVLIVSGFANVAAAGCNTIPEPPVAFRGFRGSVDRPFVRAGAGDFITIRTVSADGSPALMDTNGDGAIDERDVTVTVVFKPTDKDSRHTMFIAADCDALDSDSCCLDRLFCGHDPQCAEGAAVQLAVAGTAAAGEVRFRFPDSEFAGPLTLAVTAANRPPPSELETLRCAEMKRDDLFACIDELAPNDAGARSALANNGSAGGAAYATIAPIDPPAFAYLMALPAPNDFQKVCTKDVGDMPRCKGGAGTVRFTVEPDGAVLIPMKWTNILRVKGGGPELDRRQVRGSSAVEAVLGGGSPIVIPSGAFLETSSPLGTSFDQKPLFIPLPLRDPPNEVTLFGTSDKDDSVLRIWPRRVWDHACTGGANAGQACEPNPQDQTDKQDCPGGTCTAQTPARYFACAGGARDKLPCTRPHHCPNGGQCLAGSHCYSVSGAGTGCQTDADCGSNEECGLGLFEFRNRVKNGIGELPRSASGSFPGVCDSGEKEGQKCTSSFACNPLLLGSADCVGYHAEAIIYEPIP